MTDYLDSKTRGTLHDYGGDRISVKAHKAAFGIDNITAFQTAIDKSLATGGSIWVPEDVYGFDSYGDSVALGSGTGRRVLKAVNNTATPKRLIIQSPGAQLLNNVYENVLNNFSIQLYIEGNFSEVVIEGLWSENTHGVILGDTIALMILRSAGGYEPQNVRVNGCTLRNHSRAMHVNACDTMWVAQNKFLMEKGRDSAANDMTRPAVGVWCFVDSNGAAKNIHIHDNDYDGHEDVASIASNTNKFAADGFVFGMAKGWSITDNRCKNFAYEAIFPFPQRLSSGSATTYPTIITGNTLDCAIAAGSLLEDGVTPRRHNWAIRCDEDEALVEGNKLKDATRGIMAYTYGWNASFPSANLALKNIAIVRNQINMHPSEGEFGIQVIGGANSNEYIDQADISDNIVKWDTAASSVNAELYGAYLQNIADFKFFRNEITQRVKPGTDPVVAVHFEAATGQSGYNLFDTDIGYQRRNVVTHEVLGWDINKATVPIKSLGGSGSFKSRHQRITFTPAATGWHRILSGSGIRAMGRLRIFGNYDNKITDATLFFTMDAFTTVAPQMVLLADVNVNGGVISQVRVSNGGTTAFLDVNVASITSAGPIVIEIESLEMGTAHLISPPSQPATGGTQESLITLGTRMESVNGFASNLAYMVGLAGKWGFNHPAPEVPLHFGGLEFRFDSGTANTGAFGYLRYNNAGTQAARLGLLAELAGGTIKGASSLPVRIFNTAGEGVEVRSVTAAADKTPMYLWVHNGTAWTVRQVTVGPVDTPVAGFRVLLVPNT